MARSKVMLDSTLAARPEMLSLVAAGKHRAALVHVFALIYVTEQGTDGMLPRAALKLVHGRRTDVAALVSVGLWAETPHGWGIYDWAENKLHRPRVAVPKHVRRAVFERDGFTCVHCGSPDKLSIDHIVAWVNGGSNDLPNLQTLCVSCNSRKKDS